MMGRMMGSRRKITTCGKDKCGYLPVGLGFKRQFGHLTRVEAKLGEAKRQEGR